MDLVHAGVPALIPVVAVALIDGQGRVLLHRRAPGKHHALLWEFPGGKVEPDERAAQAITREAGEELGVVLDDLEPVSFAQGGQAPHLILLYACRRWEGTPRALEWPPAAREAGWGEGVAWFARPELAAMAEGESMPPLDRPLARALLRWLGEG